MIFWCRRWTEQSRSKRERWLPCESEKTWTSTSVSRKGGGGQLAKVNSDFALALFLSRTKCVSSSARHRLKLSEHTKRTHASAW